MKTGSEDKTFVDQVERTYTQQLSKFEQVEDEGIFTIESFLDQNDIKIHSIQSRIKSLDSLVKKAQNLEVKDPGQVFLQVNDIIGVRIICLFISDIERIAKLI